MSNTQGETSRNRVYGAISAAVLVLTLGGVGVGVAKANADAQAHTTLMAEVKADGRTLNASAGEDAELSASVVQAAQVAHINAIAAAQTAARVAAEQAAAAEAARVAAEQAAQAAAQQAAQQQAAADEDSGAPSDPPSGGNHSSGAPAGTPVPFYVGSDPNNAAGGDYADPGSFCASRSASTINGIPTCD